MIRVAICQFGEETNTFVPGCKMEDYDLVCVKSMNHFRAYFAPIADGIVAADTSGMRPANIKNVVFKHVVRPVYPLDEEVEFSCQSL